MKEIIIKLENGIWLINDKKYKDLGGIEKLFFEEFLTSIRNPNSGPHQCDQCGSVFEGLEKLEEHKVFTHI